MYTALRSGIGAFVGLIIVLSAAPAFADGIVPVFVPQITATTVSSAPASGTCDLEGGAITLVVRDLSVHTASPAVAPLCTGGAWSTTFDATGLDDGAAGELVVDVSQTDGSSTTIAATKDTVLPTIHFVVL